VGRFWGGTSWGTCGDPAQDAQKMRDMGAWESTLKGIKEGMGCGKNIYEG